MKSKAVLIAVHLPPVHGSEQTRASTYACQSILWLLTKMPNQLFGDFLGFIVPLSQYLDVESRFHFQLNRRKTFMVSFGSRSPEAEASLWNFTA
jgi:hypothetical protein